MRSLFILLQHLLPHHLLSRLTGKLAECRTTWLKNWLIQRFIARYGVDMSEARHPDPTSYANFNAFFTRELRSDARPLCADPESVLCPADGGISAIGTIAADSVFQAKGKSFSLQALLGGDAELAAQFRNGNFVTVYLSPKDYHRVHCPLDATLLEMRYVPGKLFSVNQWTADSIDQLFARNERVVCLLQTTHGPMAVILVGAMIVAGIETVWSGSVAPASHGLQRTDYRQGKPVHLQRGSELGRFKLGSTAIVLFPPGVVSWDETLQGGSAVLMGQSLGRLLRRED